MRCNYAINQAFIDSPVMQRASRDALMQHSQPSVSLWLLFPVFSHLFIAIFKAWLVINNTSITDR